MELKRLVKGITILFVCNTLFCITLLGQDNSGQILDLPNVIPPSPNAAALGKFGDIPVGAYTGIPNVGIPLYTMQVGKFSLPISLNYHSGGLKVEEVASAIGLGWALSAGGVITRSMHGQPDESPLGYLHSSGLSLDSIVASESLTNTVCKGSADIQPDMFYFNFAGESGKFILDTTAQHNARFIPFTNLMVTHDAGLDSFKITDPNGIIYIFSSAEYSNVEGAGVTPYYVSSWYLTTIITPSGNINFTYAAESTIQYQRNEADFLNETPGSCSVQVPPLQGSTASIVVDALLLTQIASPFETITFNTLASRQDMPSASSVTGMIVTDRNSHTIKYFNFAQSYFGAAGSSDPNASRLKLDRVDEVSVWDATQKKSYTFQYYSPQNVPNTQSYAKDFWGFYNGQNNNSTDLPYIDPTIYGAYIASQANTSYANKQPNGASSQVGVLQSIEYPTGGTTQFIYEGNDYSSYGGGQIVPSIMEVSSQAGLSYFNAITTFSDTTTFSITTTQTDTLSVSGSGMLNPTKKDGYGPTIILNRVNSNGSRTSIESLYYLNSFQIVYPLLAPGNYELIASIDSDTTDGKEMVSGRITYTETDTSVSNNHHILPTGGVRIKQIINTDSISGNQHIKTFTYRMPTDSTTSSGALVSALQFTEEKISPASSCEFLVRFSSPTNYLGSTQGSHIGYAAVTETETSGTSNNGKKVSYFSSPWSYANQRGQEYQIQAVDDIVPSRELGAGYHYQTDYDVYRGQLQQELLYNSSGVLIHSTVNNYNPVSIGSSPPNFYLASATAGANYYLCPVICSCFDPQNLPCDSYILYNYSVATYQVICPWIYKTNTINTSYDQNGLNPLTDTINYYYDNPTHGEVTRIIQNNSQGSSLKTVNIYPADLGQITGLDPVAATVLDTMVARNMIAPVIQEEHYNNNNLVSRQRTDYAIWSGPLRNIAPLKKWYQIGNNPIEDRINFLAYDNIDNLRQVAKINDINISYIWDYLSAYPIAEVKNADTASIAYTSFESNGTGNWVLSGGTLQTTGGLTGNNYYTLSSGGSISKSGLNTSRIYLVTYWSTNGPLSISGTTAIAGLVKNGWTFYQHTLPAGSSSVALTGTGITLDELRLYPVDALMTTYTYNPLIGATTTCSANNTITYYEYDGFQRLLRIRDMDRNIVKQYDYEYQKQGVYYSAATSGTYTRNNCATGGTPATVTYTVAASTYSSTVSQAAANTLAQNDVNANGQNYANANATCTFYNVALSDPYTRNNCAVGGTPSTVTYTVPAGTYNSTVSQAAANTLAQNDQTANGQNYANTNGICTFYNVIENNNFTCACGTGGIGSSVPYSIPANTYSSTTSQTAANQLAITALNTQGQANANTHGTCTYYNTVLNMPFTKNNCACVYTGSSVTYTVAANTYSSSVSLTAANQLATNDANANGQNYANTNGTCSTTCVGPQYKISGCTCMTGTLGVVSQTQTGSGTSTKCTTQYGYFFSDGTYLLAQRTVTNGQCLQQ